MMNNILKKIAILSVCLLSVATSLYAQGVKDVRINEILVNNVNSFEDDYGHRVGWLELHNTGFSNVNVAGCYLTVKRGSNEYTYKIPKNDPLTVIPPQGYLVFFAEGTSTKGTFHTNFTLDKTGYIALIDQSGRGPAVDSILYDVNNMKEDISIGWMLNEDKDLVFKELHSTTPNSTNNTIEFESRADIFRDRDPSGIAMALTAMTVVFLALIALYQIFKRVGKAFSANNNKVAKRASEDSKSSAAASLGDDDMSSEIIAAIAVALAKYDEDLQDMESRVLTINRVGRAYSPWSSKIYGLRQLPAKK